MAIPAVTTGRCPKRKEPIIPYHEGSSDENQVDGESGTSDEAFVTTTSKKLEASGISLSAMSPPKHHIFPFASLPTEIKNQIYNLVLTDSGGIFLARKTKHYCHTVQRAVPLPSGKTGFYGKRPHQSHLYSDPSTATPDIASPDIFPVAVSLPSLIPNILLLNRAIHAETQPMLYAGNTFALEDFAAMYTFLDTIGTKNRATVTDLTIQDWGDSIHESLDHPAFNIMTGAVSLTRLHLDCRIAWGGPVRNARQVYGDARHWLEAVGTMRGKFDAAIDIIAIHKWNMGRGNWHGADWSPDKGYELFKAELRTLLGGTKGGE